MAHSQFWEHQRLFSPLLGLSLALGVCPSNAAEDEGDPRLLDPGLWIFRLWLGLVMSLLALFYQ